MASPLEVTKTATLTGHRDCVYTLERSGKENMFFSAGGAGFVVCWDFKHPENGNLIANTNSSVYALKYLPDQDLLVVGQNFKALLVISPETKKLVHTIEMPPGSRRVTSPPSRISSSYRTLKNEIWSFRWSPISRALKRCE